MKTQLFFRVILASIFLVSMSYAPAWAVPEVVLVIDDAAGASGSSGNTVTIHLYNNVPLNGLEFTIQDSPDVLTVTKVTPSPLLVGFGVGIHDIGAGLRENDPTWRDLLGPGGAAGNLQHLLRQDKRSEHLNATVFAHLAAKLL